MVELLLQRAADVNLATEPWCRAGLDIGLTALVMAADKGPGNDDGTNFDLPYTKVVEELLRHSADVNAQAENGYSVLLYAVETQLKETVGGDDC
eukprot:Skav234242  [mRNA]  locus=scaffold1464:516938:519332:- [translate_table: standard]